MEHGGKALRRTLSAWDLTLLGVGAIIHTGIFVLTGTAAANQAGPGIMLSYLAAGLACGFAAFCYAEFASMVPIAGSAYTYAYASLGEIVAWLIGWDLILEYAVGSMTVAIGWSGYMQRLLAGAGVELPVWMSAAPSAQLPGAVVDLPAVIIVLLIMVLLVIGVRESARFDAAMVAIKLLAIVFFIAVAADKLKRATEAIQNALDQTRDLSTQLARQGTQETQEGLGTALRELLDTYVPEGVETALSVEGDESSVPPHVADQAYLVMREAVRNAVEHSGCVRVEVSIEVQDAGLWGIVEDDGQGFDPREGPEDTRSGQGDGGPDEGVGLRSMRKRAELLGGRLNLDSESGSGTVVEVWVPLAD